MLFVMTAAPEMIVVSSGWSYLQEFIPHVAQACVRGGCLLLGPRGFSQSLFQRDLGFALPRDVLVNRDPAAVVHEAIDDADGASVGNLENRVHQAADDLGGDVCIDVAGEGAVCGSYFQQFAHRTTGLRLLGR